MQMHEWRTVGSKRGGDDAAGGQEGRLQKPDVQGRTRFAQDEALEGSKLVGMKLPEGKKNGEALAKRKVYERAQASRTTIRATAKQRGPCQDP